jgi:Cu(I)/Ag(I) efflux system membrane fusion protein
MKLKNILTISVALLLGNATFAHSDSFTPAFVDTLVAPYLQLQTQLAADDLAASVVAANQLAKALEAAPDEADAEATVKALRISTTAISSAKDLKAARKPFPALSSELQLLVEHVGTTGETPLFRAYCPMASDGKGGPANWLQANETIMNPYYGAQMLHCGVIDQQIAQ